MEAVLGMILFVGTGVLFGIMVKQYDVMHYLGRKSGEFLLKKGYSGSSVVEYLEEKQEKNRKSSYTYFLKNITVVSYLMKEGDSLQRRSGTDAKSLVSVFAGKNADNLFWSAASAEQSKEQELFQKSDYQTGILADEENQKYVKLFPAGKDVGIENHFGKNRKEKKETEALAENEKAVQVSKLREYTAIKNQNRSILQKIDSGKASRNYILKKLYIVDSTTSISPKVFDFNTLLGMNLKMKKENAPQILIYHTHGASEQFVGKRKKGKKNSVIEVGEKLSKILSEKYGYQVLHDETPYDLIHGRIDRSKAYLYACRGVERTLKKYPSIQVIIDLHRDGVGNKVHRLTTIDGKRTAQVMFFNGVSRNRTGEIFYLKNNNLQANLAFSLQAKLASMAKYPDFAKPIYLKGYRYNLHLRKRAMLIELGNENNTMEEAENAMAPLADVLNEVLCGK